MSNKVKKDCIHLWEVPNLRNLFVSLDKGFREKFWQLVIAKIGSYTDILKFYTQACKKIGLRYQNGGAFYRNLRNGGYLRYLILLRLAERFRISKEDLEKSITSYRFGNSGLEIFDPRLPIEITPVFDSILVHHMLDGSISGNKRSQYSQHSLLAAERFSQKVEYVLGRVKTKRYNVATYYLPVFLIQLFLRIYGNVSFYTFKARIPTKIKTKCWEFKMAILVTAIVDEGCVDSTNVEVYSANRELLKDIREIALSLGYTCSDIKKSKNRTFLFRLRPLEKLYKDLKKLTKEYPILDLAHKQEKLEFHVKRRARSWYKKKPGVTKINILKNLLTGDKTSAQLMYKLNIASDEIGKHLKDLEMLDLVKRAGKKGNSTIWNINKLYSFKEASNIVLNKVLAQFRKQRERGRRSKIIILEAIKEGCWNSNLISQRTGIKLLTTRAYLTEMSRKGLIKKDHTIRDGLANRVVWNITKKGLIFSSAKFTCI